MTSNDIQRYDKKTVPQLLKILERHFNRFIRERDKKLGCISCSNGAVEHAGHFFAKTYSVHRFNENNVNGQCVRCNKWQHGNLINYRMGLKKKIGEKQVEWLEGTKHEKVKWDRYSLIEKILKYK